MTAGAKCPSDWACLMRPLWIALVLLVIPISARAAELLMFEQDGCPFCRKFDEEIAPDYPRSEAGQAAPLRRVNIFEDRRGGYDDLMPAVFTPTFVLVDDEGREVGRLEGYPGRRYFYPEIEPMIKRLRRAPETSATEESGEDAKIADSPNANGAGRSPAPMK
ncbi:hypothetical protein SAMN06297251_101267 [Fulvimarina manganoxydans]|uniref:Thioredoxin-like fold domain-containing protein n=2 Tax=Fulvimarina manganoxydans TaxID=937218 RepID=A0A1W1YFW6_9HYPH|nr:hypothetical protein SAMN06297251_101267 [Fulvimarina manganoxydans]